MQRIIPVAIRFRTQKQEKRLRTEIVRFFDDNAKRWGEQYKGLTLKKSDINILFEEAVFDILKERYGHLDETKIVDIKTGEIVSIFSSWKGFIGYFNKFQETRKNFYKDDGTQTAIATRIINQNLRRFAENLITMNSQIIKLEIDFTEVETNFNIHLGEIFDIDYYNKCFLQKGIDFYNGILCGETKENGEKLKGINEIINKYRQEHNGDIVPYLKSLDKQILSEKNKFIDEIKNDQQLVLILREFYTSAEAKTYTLKKLIYDLVTNNENYNLDKTYITKEALNTISHKWILDINNFESALFSVYNEIGDKNAKHNKQENSYKFPDFINLSYIKSALNQQLTEEKIWKDKYSDIVDLQDLNKWEQFLKILWHEFIQLFEREIFDKDGNKVKTGYNLFKENFKELINAPNFIVKQNSKSIIKNYADSVLWIYQIGKYFALEKKRAWVEDHELSDFYTNPQIGYLLFYYEAYSDIVQVYNKVRNYLTKKSYSENKWKLNFENPTLANGWDKNKERANTTVIFRKDGNYYLGLMKKGNNDIFTEENKDQYIRPSSHGVYQKMNYKFFPDQAKMFPKICFSKKGLEFFNPPEEIVKIYKNVEYKKGENFSVESMHKLIDFYKECLIKYPGWKLYNFHNIKETKEYRNNIGEFYSDVAKDGYLVSFEDISADYVDDYNQEGKLYLFQIKNKDWNKGATGAKNLHSLYFESLFSADNKQKNFPFKLNGQAELFFRPKTCVEKLGTKQLINGKTVINHKRYSENKMFFHVPITLNRGKDALYRFNVNINNFLANNPNVNIIGVDRGEKHLAYYSVINQKGEVLKDKDNNPISGSLNYVGKGNDGQPIDYLSKLEKRAQSREQARKDWEDIQAIKDLKRGYVSQVVKKLVDLSIKYNAIIIFEDLNMRFKQVRGGIEKSTYQQLEKALIDKLSYVVDKRENDIDKAGSLFRAYQLTSPFESFQKMGKQTGVIFYTQASYTSKIDPITGWRPNLYLKYSNSESVKKDILKFSQIIYNHDLQRYEFTYDLKKFFNSDKLPKKTCWTLCSNVERHIWNRTRNDNNGGYDHYENLTKEYEKLFDEFGILNSSNIVDQIKKLDTKGNEGFYKRFIYLWRLLCQIRNTNLKESGDKNDYIYSPVEPFFDSRIKNDKNLPLNGDDNGAYNIARKGVIILNKLSKFANENGGSCESLKWSDLTVTNNDWDNFAQIN